MDSVLAMLPPRLHCWFAQKWAEPAAWHSARTAFAQTAAVWSMAGHICGLGDRHGALLVKYPFLGLLRRLIW